MECSDSEAVFKSLNLDPQLFINEALNRVDDLVDSAFQYFQEQASTLVKTKATDGEEDLKKGIAHISNVTQTVLDKHLSMWENYCLEHCFVVPEGFKLPKSSGIPADCSTDQDYLSDPQLDAELDLLRNKLKMAHKESTDLSRQSQALEKQCVKRSRYAGTVNEIVKSYDQESVHETFQELVKQSSELRKKMEELRRRTREEANIKRLERISNPDCVIPATKRSKGLYNAKMDDLQEFHAYIKKKMNN